MISLISDYHDLLLDALVLFRFSDRGEALIAGAAERFERARYAAGSVADRSSVAEAEFEQLAARAAGRLGNRARQRNRDQASERIALPSRARVLEGAGSRRRAIRRAESFFVEPTGVVASHDDQAQDVHVIAPDRSSVSLEASQATVPSPTASTPITISVFDAGGLIGSRCRR